MRESHVEKAVVAFAVLQGWLSYKWKSANTAGLPDRLFFKNGRVIMIEFKAPGKLPRKKQLLVHARLKKQGFEVYVIDNIEKGKRLFAD